MIIGADTACNKLDPRLTNWRLSSRKRYLCMCLRQVNMRFIMRQKKL